MFTTYICETSYLKSVPNKIFAPPSFCKNYKIVWLHHTWLGHNEMMEHLSKEFCIEILIFLTFMWQFELLLFTLKFGQQNEKTSKVQPIQPLLFKNKFIKLPKNVPISPIITEMATKFGKNNINKTHQLYQSGGSEPIPVVLNMASTSISSSDGSDESADIFAMFSNLFEFVYKRFIQSQVAVMEINISHELREELKTHFEYLCQCKTSSENKIDYNRCLQIWDSLREACKEMWLLLYRSFVRSILRSKTTNLV